MFLTHTKSKVTKTEKVEKTNSHLENTLDVSFFDDLLEDDTRKWKRVSPFPTYPNTSKALTNDDTIHPSAKPTSTQRKNKKVERE